MSFTRDDCTTAAEAIARIKRSHALRQASYKPRPAPKVVKTPPPPPVIKAAPPPPLPLEEPPPAPPTVRMVICAAADYFNVRYEDFLTVRRAQPLCRYRQIAIYIARMVTPYSLPHIAKMFGGRDHTTIMHSCEIIETRKETNPEVAKAVADLLAYFAKKETP